MDILKKIDLKSLIFNLFMPVGLSLIVTMLIGSFSDYFDTLDKPFNVPAIIFPIVWLILYLMMGLASYIVYEEDSTFSRNSYYLYWISLIVNLLWPVMFFGFKLLNFSALWLILLLVLVIIVTLRYKKINKLSFYLMIPYVLWLVFALYLNISIALLNK